MLRRGSSLGSYPPLSRVPSPRLIPLVLRPAVGETRFGPSKEENFSFGRTKIFWRTPGQHAVFVPKNPQLPPPPSVGGGAKAGRE